MEVVTDGKGQFIYSPKKTRILVKLPNEDTLCFVLYTTSETTSDDPSSNTQEQQLENGNNNNPDTCPSDSLISLPDDNRSWSHAEILQLIALYEEHKPFFNSTTTKNEKVWQMISNKIKSHTSGQCESKFKYLKSRYVKKIDNMSTKKTGERSFKFEYFEQFDKLFGKQPNIKPQHLASSIGGVNNIKKRKRDIEVEELEMCGASTPADTEEETIPEKKTKTDTKGKTTQNKVKVDQQLTEVVNILKEKEKSKKERHEESMQLRREALDTFKTSIKNLQENMYG